MTVPHLSVRSVSPEHSTAEILVIGVRTTDDGPALAVADSGQEWLSVALASIGATGAKDELLRIPNPSGTPASLALVGLGRGEPDADTLRYAAGVAARRLTGIDSLEIALPSTTEEDVRAILEGAAIGAYCYTAYKSASLDATKLPAKSIVVTTSLDLSDGTVERATAIAEAIHTVRDLVNAPPIDLYPETFAERVHEAISGLPIDIDVLGEDELRSGGFGGILGVGMGSTRGPRLVKLSYSPAGAEKHLALVGKGITFDTGGLSLKSPAGMVGMKYDMTGAASVLAVIAASARLGLDLRITGWLCLAENMPSGSAIRPNDVLSIRGGTTVEVLNTDAEGRLVMADGLVAASEEFPDAIIDIATLTGAQRVALGDRYSGVMGAEALVSQLTAAAAQSGELLWAMPLPAELRALLNSDVADIANAKIGNTAAGMLLAGVFLQEFIGKRQDPGQGLIPWAHIDIAGPAQNSGGGYGFVGTGPTGVMVRTLIALAEDISRP